jgi:prephenate dehydrogenase
MTEPRAKISIIGTGLIGGSLGLALKHGGIRETEIVGYDENRGTAKRAEKLGAIDRSATKVSDAVEGAAVVIVATPILSIRDVLLAVAPHLGEGTVVTDTASTKAQVGRWARDVLPESVSFVGGHPMAGKENQGIENAEAGLFAGRVYCICPGTDAEPQAIRAVAGLASAAGAEPMYMDAEEHDQYAAAVSHLPLFIATALFRLIRNSPSWEDLGSVASSGFRDMTRLASGDPGMSHGIWLTNREAIIHWLDRMTGEIAALRELLKDNQDEQLLKAFSEAALQREAFLTEPPRRAPKRSAEVDHGATVMDMLIGRMAAESMRKAQKLPELVEEQKKAEPGKPARPSFGERVAEGVRRDLEKLEQKRAEEEARKKSGKPGDAE